MVLFSFHHAIPCSRGKTSPCQPQGDTGARAQCSSCGVHPDVPAPLAPSQPPPAALGFSLRPHRTFVDQVSPRLQARLIVHTQNPCSVDVQVPLTALPGAGLQTPVLSRQPGPWKQSRDGQASSSCPPAPLNTDATGASRQQRRAWRGPGVPLRGSGVCTRMPPDLSSSGWGMQCEPRAKIASVLSRKMLQGRDTRPPCQKCEVGMFSIQANQPREQKPRARAIHLPGEGNVPGPPEGNPGRPGAEIPNNKQEPNKSQGIKGSRARTCHRI